MQFSDYSMSAPPGLCASCAHVQVMHSDRESIFYRCKLSDTDSRFPKYPSLPVLECSGYNQIQDA